MTMLFAVLMKAMMMMIIVMIMVIMCNELFSFPGAVISCLINNSVSAEQLTNK